MLSYAYENGEEEIVLGLDFRRHLGNLQNCNDPAWLNSTVGPGELEYMASTW